MPATRRPRRDIVLRVPKAMPSRGGGSGLGGGSTLARGHEYGGALASSSSSSSLPFAGLADASSAAAGPSNTGRRAVSPVKGLGRGGAHQDHAAAAASAAMTGTGHDREGLTAGPSSNSLGSSYPYAAQSTSAAEWNSLLIWARRQRGPQWDSATGMWQVDEGSTEYYAFGNDPARHTKLSRAAKRPARPEEGAAATSQGDASAANMAASTAVGPGGLVSAATPGSAATTSGEPGSAIPWNTSMAHPSLRGGGPPGAPTGAILSTHGSGVTAGSGPGIHGGPTGSFAGDHSAHTPQPGEDSPPPMGPGMRRSRAR